MILPCINLTLEGIQIFNRKLKYFSEWQNYVEISLSVLTISFVLSVRFNDCFCPNASQWQLGSVVIFLAWVNLILLMKSIPFVAISINMLISIMKLIYKACIPLSDSNCFIWNTFIFIISSTSKLFVISVVNI